MYKSRNRNGNRSNLLLETGVVTALSAGTAGSVAAVVTTPVDVVKTRVMLGAADDGSNEDMDRASKGEIVRRKRGGWAVGKEVLRTEGVRGLFRGVGLRGTWTAVGSGLYSATYESGRRRLKGRRNGEGRMVREEM